MKTQKDIFKMQKKILAHLAIVIGICVTFLLAGMEGHAAKTATVIPPSAKVRTEANTTSEAVGSLAAGETITIASETKGTDGKVWYEITVDGKKGYIRSDLVAEKADGDTTSQTASASGTASGDKGTIKSDSVRVRKEAATTSDVVATLGKGVSLNVLAKSTGSDGKEWSKVSFQYQEKTVEGFVRSDFITYGELPAEEPEVTEVNGNMKVDANSGEVVDEPADTENPATAPEGEGTVPEGDAAAPPEDTAPEGGAPAKEDITLLNTEIVPVIPEGFAEVELNWQGQTIKSWKNGDFFIFYAQKTGEAEGWYMYDSIEGTYQRYQEPSADSQKQGVSGSTQMIVIIALAVVAVVLLILLSVLFLKYKDMKEEFSWDEEDEEGDDDEDSPVRVKQPAVSVTKKRLNFLSVDEDDEDEDDDEYEDDDDDDDDDEDDMPSARYIQRKRKSAASNRPTGTPRPVSSQRPTDIQKPMGTGASRPTGEPRPTNTTRPSNVQRPTGQAPVGTSRPAAGQRPVSNQRPPQEQRPQGGQRPAGGQRPQGGQRPAGGQRPQGGQRPPENKKKIDFVDIE